MKNPIALAIHGGAGALRPDSYPKKVMIKYQDSLKEILSLGVGLLKSGEESIAVVLNLCVQLENNPLFNAGKGSVFNSLGEIEMDASIMNGKTLQGAGVACLKNIKNPIIGAKIIDDHSPHTLMVGDEAQDFITKYKVATKSADYFKTKMRFEQFLKFKNGDKATLDHGGGSTVGAVALDQYGNLAAATSTGGMNGKLPGRVSDSAIIGAGTYANNKTCAISATGTGDQFILSSAASSVSLLMEHANMSLEEACKVTLEKILSLGGNGGMICIDSAGNVHCPFNSLGMFRAFYSSVTGKLSYKHL